MKISNIVTWGLVCVVLSFGVLKARPPFITDDPDALPYKHGETYVGTQGTLTNNEINAFLPLFEVDYGVLKDTQLRMVVPLTIDKKRKQSRYYGPGIIELGVKYRIIHETKSIPQIGIFPLVELPTGDSRKGLGNGKTQFFIPVWVQKSWGRKGRKWTTYGGGGYWFNPGLNNKNYCFFGLVIQRQMTKIWWSGLEVLYQKKTKLTEHESFGFNLGGGLTLHKDWQILYSCGSNTGLGHFLFYAALYHTW